MATRLIIFLYVRDGETQYVPCGTWECYRIKEQRLTVAHNIGAKIIALEKN